MKNEAPYAYDLGMNNGDDAAYYLTKGFRVVGIDANPMMCDLCSKRFAAEIAAGRMVIFNIGVSDHESRSEFSINVAKPMISTFEPERFDREEWAPKEWRTIEVDTRPISSIIARLGLPEFIKIDVEYSDHLVLADLLAHGLVPRFLSVEAHQIECYELLVEMGYRRFRLMPGETVNERFGTALIRKLDGTSVAYAFPYDSSGPFGDDFADPWLDAETALQELRRHGLGWIDIHATL